VSFRFFFFFFFTRERRRFIIKILFLLVDNVGLNVFEHLRVDRCSQSSDRIPSLSAKESLAAWTASVFCANVVSFGDVGEGQWVGCSHLVEERIQETKRLSSVGNDVVIEEGDNSCEDRGSARCSTDRFN